MKKCAKCGEAKVFEDFHKHKKSSDGRQPYCKVCMKARNAAYYRATPERNEQRGMSRLRMREAARTFVIDYLRKNPCVDCGESDPVVLEFDHVRGVKDIEVSVMVSRGFGIERISEEITKCDVRCANCHRRITAIRGNWFSVQMTDLNRVPLYH